MAYLWKTPEPTRERVFNGEPTLMSVKTKGILCTPQYEIISFRDLLALAWMRLALLDSINFLQTPDLRLPCPAHADARSGNVGSSHQFALDKRDKDVAMPQNIPPFSSTNIPRLHGRHLDP
jgi:hypothetical protein